MPRNYPKPIRALSVEEIDLFWSKVQRGSVDECWPWTAGLKHGYGCFKIDRGSFKSSRIARFLATGINPPDCVLHKCDNPPCCNPSHLFDGTLQDNVADMMAKGRNASGDCLRHPESRRRGDDHWARQHPEWLARGTGNGSKLHPERLARGSDNGNSKLTEDNVRDIRSRFAKGQTPGDIAAIFGVWNTSVWNVIHRRTWKHVK